MAKLFFRYGSMSSGKSAHLLLTNFNYIERGMHTLILTSSKDIRFGKKLIKSRAGLEAEAIEIDDNINVYELIHKQGKIDCVLIDEIQFFKKEQIYQLSDVVDILDIPVICYGLRSTFQLTPFETSSYLFALADDISELKTICWCGKKAIVNARLLNDEIIKIGDEVLIGDTNYTSLCRKHYKENKLK
jgi:thymidine kinase